MSANPERSSFLPTYSPNAQPEPIPQSDEQISQADKQIAQGDEQIAQGDEQIAQVDEQIPQADEQISQGDEQIPQAESKRRSDRPVQALSDRPVQALSDAPSQAPSDRPVQALSNRPAQALIDNLPRTNPLELRITFTTRGEPIIDTTDLYMHMSPAEQLHFGDPQRLSDFFKTICEQSRKINNVTDPIDFCNRLYDAFSKQGFPAPDLNVSSAALSYFLPSSIKDREMQSSYFSTCRQCSESDQGSFNCICGFIFCCFLCNFLATSCWRCIIECDPPDERDHMEGGAALLATLNKNERESMNNILQEYLKDIAALSRFPSLNLSHNQIILSLAEAIKGVRLTPLEAPLDLSPLTIKFKELSAVTVLNLEEIGLWAAERKSLMEFLHALLLELRTPLKSLNISNNRLYLILKREDFRTLGRWITQSRIPVIKLFDSNYPKEWLERAPQSIGQTLYEKFEAFQQGLKGVKGNWTLVGIDDMFTQDTIDKNISAAGHKEKCEEMNNKLRANNQMRAVMMACHPRLGANSSFPGLHFLFDRNNLKDIFEFAGFLEPKPEAEPESEVESESEVEVEPKPKPEFKIEVEPKSESVVEFEVEPELESESEPAPERTRRKREREIRL